MLESTTIITFQVNPEKYRNMIHGFKVTAAEEGARGFVKGWAPTFIGYSMQGLFKFGLYEVFKNVYSDMAGEVRSEVCVCCESYPEIITGVCILLSYQPVSCCISQCRVFC